MRGSRDLPGTPPAGDREWLRGLYERNRDLVFRYAVSRVGRDAALDVVADTFVEVARARAGFDPRRGGEPSWLLGIATNRIRRWRRDQARHAHAPELPNDHGGEDADLVALPDRIDAERRSAEVTRAVAALPEGERAAILLHAVEGMSVAEVAASLRIGRSAAKVRIFRARRRLRASLSHHDAAKEAS